MVIAPVISLIGCAAVEKVTRFFSRKLRSGSSSRNVTLELGHFRTHGLPNVEASKSMVVASAMGRAGSCTTIKSFAF
jgi:hypothetical protein